MCVLPQILPGWWYKADAVRLPPGNNPGEDVQNPAPSTSLTFLDYLVLSEGGKSQQRVGSHDLDGHNKSAGATASQAFNDIVSGNKSAGSARSNLSKRAQKKLEKKMKSRKGRKAAAAAAAVANAATPAHGSDGDGASSAISGQEPLQGENSFKKAEETIVLDGHRHLVDLAPSEVQELSRKLQLLWRKL